MVRVRCFRVRPEKVGRLRDWMDELSRRRDEVLETFANETVRHEVGYLFETTDGPMLSTWLRRRTSSKRLGPSRRIPSPSTWNIET
jgi:Family of unknown function (DUF6176)